MEVTMKCGRREFIKTGSAVLACTYLSSLCLRSCSPLSNISNTAQVPVESYRLEAGQVVLDLKKTSDLTIIGGSVKLEFNHPDVGTPTKIVLVHPENTSYLAFSNSCTHKGRELEYDHEAKKLHCMSGHSEFDLSGKVLEGNADRPLKDYPVELDGDTLIVKI
jgi:Rieske Fe-S protein